jgi:hypothetical protein
MNFLPSGVNSYSTRGGASGRTSGVSSPSRSRLRSVAVKFFEKAAGTEVGIGLVKATQQ